MHFLLKDSFILLCLGFISSSTGRQSSLCFLLLPSSITEGAVPVTFSTLQNLLYTHSVLGQFLHACTSVLCLPIILSVNCPPVKLKLLCYLRCFVRLWTFASVPVHDTVIDGTTFLCCCSSSDLWARWQGVLLIHTYTVKYTVSLKWWLD